MNEISPAPLRPQVDPFVPRLPRLSGPYGRAHAVIGGDARVFIDRVLDFLGMDLAAIRRRWFDSVRHGARPVLSWMPDRSSAEPVQMLRHTVVRYAFDDVILRPGACLTIETPFSDPVEIYAYRLVIMPGAEVRLLGGPARLVIGCLVGARPGNGDVPTITMVSADGRPGEAGARGQDGAHGSHDMPQGGPGHGGSQGSHGTAGAPLHDVTLQVHTLQGLVRLRAQPGAGGDGGAGGAGGAGAIGHSISLYKMGQGGDGADGAPGGDGGAAGDGGLLHLDVRMRGPGAVLSLDVQAGRPGLAGAGGAGGAGGMGVPDGAAGQAGPQGSAGRAGRPVNIQWAQQPALGAQSQ